MKVPSIASVIVLGVALAGVNVLAQARGGTPQTDKVQPVNSGANPYRVIRDWGKIEGRAWGGSNGVAIDKDGKTVWAVDRCSPGTFAFRDQNAAAEFVAENGGIVLRLAEFLEEGQAK